jgi:hypothetical protein
MITTRSMYRDLSHSKALLLDTVPVAEYMTISQNVKCRISQGVLPGADRGTVQCLSENIVGHTGAWTRLESGIVENTLNQPLTTY